MDAKNCLNPSCVTVEIFTRDDDDDEEDEDVILIALGLVEIQRESSNRARRTTCHVPSRYRVTRDKVLKLSFLLHPAAKTNVSSLLRSQRASTASEFSSRVISRINVHARIRDRRDRSYTPRVDDPTMSVLRLCAFLILPDSKRAFRRANCGARIAFKVGLKGLVGRTQRVLNAPANGLDRSPVSDFTSSSSSSVSASCADIESACTAA